MIPAPPPDHVPFLQAVVANPADDLARLIYADFLEESGDADLIARAHFIRAQIAIESLTPRSRKAVQTGALIARLTDLFMETFQFELPLWLVNEGIVSYQRGFLATIDIAANRLETDGADLFNHFPITGLILSRGNIAQSNQWLSQFSFLQRLSFLGFGSAFYPLTHYPSRDDDDGTPFFYELMQTPVLSSLQTLSFQGTRVTDAWLVRFVSLLERSAFAETLRVLDFHDCLLIGDAGANTLATARGLDRLTKLNLKNVQLNDMSRSMLRRRFADRVRF